MDVLAAKYNGLPERVANPAGGVEPLLLSNLFTDAARAVREWKFLVVVCGLAGVLLSVVLLLYTQPVYNAVATLEVQGVNENFMNLTAVDPQAGTGAYSSNAINIQTQLRIIESLSLRQHVIERLQRETPPMLPRQSGLFAQLRNRLHIHSADPLESTRVAILMAGQTIRARAITGTRIIAISCESTNPRIAASFANALSGDYIAQSFEVRSLNAQKTTQWLAGQLEETKARLEQAETKLQAFIRQSGGAFAGNQETLANSKLTALQGQLAAVQAEAIARRSQLEKAAAAPPDAFAEIVGDINLRGYVQKINELTRERAQWLVTLTPEHQKIKALDDQIAFFNASYKKSRQDVLRRFQSEYDEVLKRQNMLAASYAEQANAVTGQADKASQYATLRREVEMLRQTMNVILQQANQASVASALPANSVRVIDPATAAQYPLRPAAKVETAKGGIAGLAAGVVLAFFIERRRRRTMAHRFCEPGRSALLLDVRELGVIPSAQGKKPLFGAVPGISTVRGLLGSRRSTGNGAAALESKIVKPGFFPAESFRMVVASLLREPESHDGPRVIVVTSPGAGEGKTTISTHLARAMAEIGRTVLIISADLRRPHLDELFDSTGAPGLSDVIATDDPFDYEYLASLILETRDRNTHILPGGTSAENIAGMFYSPNMRPLFEHLRTQYDVVIVDTPPLLQFAEARILGRMADGVLLVLRSGSTEEAAAIAARQLLMNDHIPLLGAVLNDWKPPEPARYPAYYSSSAQKM